MATWLDAGVIGCGRMGAFTSAALRKFAPPFWLPLSHAEGIAAHPRLRLAALCDNQAEAIARAAVAYGVSANFSDYRRLIKEVRPALLGIATRTIGRAEIIAEAVAGGTHALHIEKPLCNSMNELVSLEILLTPDDVFFTFGAIRRLLYPYKAARDFVSSGALGALLEVQVNMGRGRLYWTHPHAVDAILFAAGDRSVQSVTARLANVEYGRTRHEIITDPWVESATVLFEDGVEGHITRSPGSDIIFSCERGSLAIEADGKDLWLYEVRGDDPYPRRHAWPIEANHNPGGILAALCLLVNCLAGDPVAVVANRTIKRDVFRGQRLLFAIAQSAAEDGRSVRPEETDPDWVIWARSGSAFA